MLRTPFALWANGRALQRAGALLPATGDPSRRRAPLDPGPPVLARGYTGLVLFALVVLVAIVALRML